MRVRTTATNPAKTECLRLFSNPSPALVQLLDGLDARRIGPDAHGRAALKPNPRNPTPVNEIDGRLEGGYLMSHPDITHGMT
jgi:hypothetical protein